MNYLIALAVLSAVAANATLQFGLGIRELIFSRPNAARSALLPSSAMFASGILSWFLFAYIFAPLALGFLEPLILFPIASLVCIGMERLFLRISIEYQSRIPNAALSAYDGLAFGSSYLVLRFSSRMLDALAISFGAAIGFYFCSLLLNAIRSRSDIEAVSRFLRGAPLFLISAGLLSLLSTFAAAAVFTAIGGHP